MGRENTRAHIFEMSRINEICRLDHTYFDKIDVHLYYRILHSGAYREDQSPTLEAPTGKLLHNWKISDFHDRLVTNFHEYTSFPT